MQIELKDFTMSYEDAGDGLPVVFIHGYPLGRWMWAPQIAGLADAARVIAPDLRGHGDSSATAGEYTMDLLADDIHAMLDILAIKKPVVLCGLSMGGYVALAFCRRYPQRVAGLVMAASRASADAPETRANRDKTMALAKEKGLPAIVEQMLPKMMAPQTYQTKPELVERVRLIMEAVSLDGVLGDQAGMKNRPDSLPTLAAFDKPLLIIQGEEDQFAPREVAEAMKNAAPQARMALIPAAGHLPNLEQPELFNQVLREFLKQL